MGNCNLGRDESKHLKCEYENRVSECPKDCAKCEIGIKTDGDIALASGNYAKAIEHYRKAVFLSPKFAEAWNNMGNAYGMGSNYEKALSAFDKAISIDPTYGKALYGKAITLRNLKRIGEARQLGNSILELYDNDEVRRFVKELACSSTHVSNRDSEFKSLAMSILDKNDLLNFDGTYSIIEEIYQEESLTEKLLQYCRETYTSRGRSKLLGEYIITTYYASVCAAILYQQDIIDKDEDMYDELDCYCDLEFLDKEAEELLNTEAGEERAERIWNTISPYVGFCTSVFEESDDDMIILNAMKYAYIIGMLVGKTEYESYLDEDDVDDQLQRVADSEPTDAPAPVDSAMCYSPRDYSLQDYIRQRDSEEERKRKFFEELRGKYGRGL